MPRSRLLHACGVSILTVSQKAYSRAHDIDGPLGQIVNSIDRLLTSAFPLIYAIQHECLAVLSFADDQLLVVEDLVETLIPQSACVFSRIDQLVHAVEFLPGKCDHAMDKFATIMHQGPFFDWGMAYFIFWLDCLIASLIHWGSKFTREKTILIDINCNESAPLDYDHLQAMDEIKKGGKDEQDVESPMSSSPKSCCSEEPKTVTKCSYKEILESPNDSQYESLQDEIKKSGKDESPIPSPKSSSSDESRTDMKCSYKEILKKGTHDESNEKKEDIVREEEIGVRREIKTNKNNEQIVTEDPILELFESSWHLSPGKVNPLRRSIFDP